MSEIYSCPRKTFPPASAASTSRTANQKMTMKKQILLSLAALLLHSCADNTTVAPTVKKAGPDSIPHAGKDWDVRSIQHGKASWYSVKTNFGTRTASGERLSNNAYTAAHKTLPLGTKVRVTNLSNGKSEILRITDRGPYVRGRIIDVTVGSATRLGFYGRGVTSVKVEVLKPKQKTAEVADAARSKVNEG